MAPSQSFFSASVLLLVAFMSGCSSQNWAGGGSEPAVQIHGAVHGGQQPIPGATIQLYAVGGSGFKSASTALLTSTVTTDANGNFNITGKYSCASASLVYITATGGQPTASGTNANAAMMTALGPCSSLTSATFISINELTTVGAVSALAPYMASMTAIGSSSTGKYSADEFLALSQGFTLAEQFVDSGTGVAPGQNIPSGMTDNTSLINTLGDVLAACINSSGGVAGDGSACGTLFALSTPSGGTAPTDTITAMLNIANHPTVNINGLFNLSSPTSPFQPSLNSAPSTFDVVLIPMAFNVTRTFYVEPDDGLTFAYNLVNSATKTIDMTIYGLVDTTLSGYMVAACQRGVIVRVIMDQNNEMTVDTPAYNQLNAQPNCSAVWANPQFQVTHQKSFVVDNTTLALLTLNLETHSYAGTRDFALVTNDPVDVAAVETTFAADYGSTTDYSFAPPAGNDLIWSPTTARSSLVSLINNATSSLEIENEEMSDPTVIAALKAACMRGVATQITMTNQTSYHANFAALEAAGCGVHVYANSTKVIYIHAKVIIADYGTNAEISYIGSINFSTASLIENRELGTFISDTTIEQRLFNTLSSDYAGAPAY